MLWQPRNNVPFMFPKRSYSFETLMEYLSALSGLVAYYPLDDASGNMARVINPAVALGRNLVINGGLSADANWSKATGVTITGGVAVFTSVTAAGGVLNQASVLVPGKTYEFTFEVIEYTGGSVRIQDNAGVGGTFRNAVGVYTQNLTVAGSSIQFAISGTTTLKIDNVSVRQVNIPASSSIADTELLADRDMEAATTAAYSAAASATLTKETADPHGGLRNLKVARNGATNPSAFQNIFTNGKRFRIRVFARGDGIATPRIAGSNTWANGTSSTSWQALDAVTIPEPSSVNVNFQSVTSTGTQYTEWDDASVIEVPPMSGYNGNGAAANVPTVNQDAGSKLLKAYSLDGNDYVNVYSADLNSAFDPRHYTHGCFVKMSAAGDWTDGTLRVIFIDRADTNNSFAIFKSATNNTITFQIFAGGTLKTFNVGSLSYTDWFHVAITLDADTDQAKGFINGVQVGSTQTGLGVWVGNLSTTQTVIGANNTSAANGHKGQLAHDFRASRALSDADIYRIAKLGGVA